jgi:hypothetical protein
VLQLQPVHVAGFHPTIFYGETHNRCSFLAALSRLKQATSGRVKHF